ncbi:MAG TPA: hypothetical protein VGB99_16885 [Acidobacteriota bacterium]
MSLRARTVRLLLWSSIGWSATHAFTAAPTSQSEPAGSASTRLEWKAAKERNIYGYLIYRSERREGPYLRINPELVHVRHQAGNSPSEYAFEDRQVEPCKTYYYYLDYVTGSGLKRRFSGMLSKPVPCDSSDEN